MTYCFFDRPWRRFLAAAGFLLALLAGCDSTIASERTPFALNGQKYCPSRQSFVHINMNDLHCGDCDQPCGTNQKCVQFECRDVLPQGGGGSGGGNAGYQTSSDCDYYLNCLEYGCARACELHADCQTVELACVEETRQSVDPTFTLEMLREGGVPPLQCEPTSGTCFVPKETTPPPPEPPPSGGGGGGGGGSGGGSGGGGYQPPPPPTCNVDCSATGRICENGECVCNGCWHEAKRRCYQVGEKAHFGSNLGCEDPGVMCECKADGQFEDLAYCDDVRVPC